MSDSTLSILIVSLGALITIAATVVSGVRQERLSKRREGVAQKLAHLEGRQRERTNEMAKATAERNVAFMMLSIAQATDPDRQDTIITTLPVAGFRMAQAVVAAVGVIYGEDDDGGPEQVEAYFKKENLHPVIAIARAGDPVAINLLHRVYEHLYSVWAGEYNRLTAQIEDLSRKVAAYDTQIVRVRYIATSLQVTGVVVALFKDLVA